MMAPTKRLLRKNYLTRSIHKIRFKYCIKLFFQSRNEVKKSLPNTASSHSRLLYLKKLVEKTKRNKELTINFAMGYSGRTEIVDAVNELLQRKPRKITEKDISKHLYMSEEPDLIIRTGGEQRISDFLIWQGTYSEFVFTKKLWPEFTKKDLMRCLAEFKERERRFGV